MEPSIDDSLSSMRACHISQRRSMTTARSNLFRTKGPSPAMITCLRHTAMHGTLAARDICLFLVFCECPVEESRGRRVH